MDKRNRKDDDKELKALILRIRQGERQAQGKLLEALWPQVISYAGRRFWGSEVMRHRLVQRFLDRYPDVLERFRYGSEVPLRAWLAVLLRNWSSQIYRDRSRMEFVEVDLERCPAPSEYRCADATGGLSFCLEQLSVRDRSLLQLRFPELLEPGDLHALLRRLGMDPGEAGQWCHEIEARALEARMRARKIEDRIAFLTVRISEYNLQPGAGSESALRLAEQRAGLRRRMCRPVRLSYNELGRIFGCPPGTVASALSRIKTELRRNRFSGRTGTTKAV